MNDMEFCQKHLEAAYKTAEKYYGTSLVRPDLKLKSQVSRAGYYKCAIGEWAIKPSVDGKPGKYYIIRPMIMISSYWLKHKGREVVIQTIYHEVAHGVVAELFGKVKSHGPEWKNVMRVVFERKADRCLKHTVKTISDKIKRRNKSNPDNGSVITGGRKKRLKTLRVRTPEQIQADKDRMAKVRANRNKKSLVSKLIDNLKKLLRKFYSK